MDFVTGLPRTAAGHDAILVFVDRATKMTHFAACKKSITAEQTGSLFLQHVVRLHGEPTEVISDRGSQFASEFLKGYLKALGTESLLSSAYRPQTDGQTERMNRVLEEMLRSFTAPSAANWDKLLPMAEFAVNNAVNRSTGSTPFFLNYGRHPGTPFNKGLPAHYRLHDTAKHATDDLREALLRARSTMDAAQQRQAAYYNLNKTDLQLSPGELVLLSTKNLRSGAFQKLQPRWVGPFPVDKHIGKNAVKLVLPPSLPIHDVFHVSLLKAYKAPSSPSLQADQMQTVLPLMKDQPGQDASIVAERTEVTYRQTRSSNHRVEKTLYRVHFTGHDPSMDVWLSWKQLPKELRDQYQAAKPSQELGS
jgi:hypothetical protein